MYELGWVSGSRLVMHLLIADKSENDLQHAADAVTPLGHDVSCVRSPEHALRVSAQAPPDLLIVDTSFRESASSDFVWRLRNRTDHFLPLLVTRQAGLSEPGLTEGADELLDKPYDGEQLRLRVDSLLRQKERVNRLEQRCHELSSALSGQREMMEFLVHDLRAPTFIIQASLGYVMEAVVQEDTEVLGALRDATDAALRIEHYAEDLLAIAESEQGGMRLRSAPLNVASLLDDVMGEFRRRFSLAGLSIDTRAERSLVVEGDAHTLARVLENLVDNASRHMSQGDRLLLSAEREGDKSVCIRVSNNGVRIPLEMRARIFDKFVRQPGSGAYRQSGIGLYFCSLAIGQHGGTIAVEDYSGWTTTFAIRLPGL